MERETAFWEAVVAIAPLLGLTIVLEIRQARWQEYRPGFRVVAMLAMCLCLFGLAWAASTAMITLYEWDVEKPPSAVTGRVILLIIQLAIAGVLMPPISQTFVIFFGRGAPTMRRLHRLHSKGKKKYSRHMGHLMAEKHAVLIEIGEFVTSNPEKVFRRVGSATQVVTTDPKLQELRANLQGLRSVLETNAQEWKRVDKKNRKLLKRADKKIGMARRTEIIDRMWRSPGARSMER